MDGTSILQEEIEVLQSIYMDDLLVSEKTDRRTVILTMTLHPSTADDDDKKFVCLTLDISISDQYPEQIPEFIIKNPRGLSDAHLESIEENLVALSTSRIGESMLYELFDYAKDALTDNNRPSCVCSICLEYFKETDEFFRTECYHYYHYTCISGYVLTTDEKKCPVCRKDFVIGTDVLDLYGLKENISSQTSTFVPDQKYIAWRKQCEIMFEKQKKNGGIIDLEFEKNKFLIRVTDEAEVTPANQTASSENHDVKLIVEPSPSTIKQPTNEMNAKQKYKTETRRKEYNEAKHGRHNKPFNQRNQQQHQNTSNKQNSKPPDREYRNDKKPEEKDRGGYRKDKKPAVERDRGYRNDKKPLVEKDKQSRKVVPRASENRHDRGRGKDHSKVKESRPPISKANERELLTGKNSRIVENSKTVVDTVPKTLKEEIPTKSVKKKTSVLQSDHTSVVAVVSDSNVTQQKSSRPPPGFPAMTSSSSSKSSNVRPPPGF